jgi:hypothetical protein
MERYSTLGLAGLSFVFAAVIGCGGSTFNLLPDSNEPSADAQPSGAQSGSSSTGPRDGDSSSEAVGPPGEPSGQAGTDATAGEGGVPVSMPRSDAGSRVVGGLSSVGRWTETAASGGPTPVSLSNQRLETWTRVCNSTGSICINGGIAP